MVVVSMLQGCIVQFYGVVIAGILVDITESKTIAYESPASQSRKRNKVDIAVASRR